MNIKKNIIGFYGCPSESVIQSVRDKYPDHEWVDLDVDYSNPDSGILHGAYCRIIRNIIDNSISLKNTLELVIASVGADKCDGGRYAAFLLRQLGFNIMEVSNDEVKTCENPELIEVPISSSGLPLVDKIDRIMNGILHRDEDEYARVEPTHGFWGVPPNDFDLLRLFPDSTHVYGWTRTVEANRPADIDLECYVDDGVPTVFFFQSFCAKSQLAMYLAKKHTGLYIDIDGKIGMGTKAKIEAFLELSKRQDE
ncbi:MAG: hypothetical protein ABIG42_11625 [bacterium]